MSVSAEMLAIAPLALKLNQLHRIARIRELPFTPIALSPTTALRYGRTSIEPSGQKITRNSASGAS